MTEQAAEPDDEKVTPPDEIDALSVMTESLRPFDTVTKVRMMEYLLDRFSLWTLIYKLNEKDTR